MFVGFWIPYFCWFLRFNLELYYQHLSFCILTSKIIIGTLLFSFLLLLSFFYYLFWSFSTIYKDSVPSLLVKKVQKRKYYISVSSLRSKIISITFRVVLLSLHVFFLPFSGILTWKGINDTYRMNYTYLPVVYTLNAPSAPFFFVYNRKKCNIYISYCPLGFKRGIVPLKYVRWYVVSVFFPSQVHYLFCFLRFKS